MTSAIKKKIPTPSFSIIIPNFDGQYFLPTCLKSLTSSLNIANTKHYQIILVDNASTDKSIDTFLKTTSLSHSTIISNSTNLGFSQAINQGIKKAKYKFVVICNNDMKFNLQWFSQMKKVILKKPNFACYCGLVLNHDGSKIESAGFKYLWRGRTKQIGHNFPYNQNSISKLDIKKTKKIWGAPASLIIYKKNILKKMNGFDQNFFAYVEDVDLAFRLYKQKNKTLFVPKAISYHLGGATSSNMGNLKSKMNARNWILLIIKNYSLENFIQYLPQIIFERIDNLYYLLKQTIQVYKLKSIWILPISIINIYGHILLNLPKLIRQRKNY